MSKRICIDINSVVPLFVFGYVSGVGRTTLELVEALAEIKDELPFEITLYSQNMKGIGGRNLNTPFKNRHLYLPYRYKYSKFLGKYPLREIFTCYDLLHIPHNFEYVHCPEKTLITLHDAMFYSYPEPFLVGKGMKKMITSLAVKAKGIVTCSESSKKDIMKYMKIAEEKITVIPWGISTKQFFPESREYIHKTMFKFSLNKPYFIMVSCDIGRKNTAMLMENFRNYIQEGGQYDLVLVWENPPLDLLNNYKKEIDHKRIHFVGGLSETDIRAMYSGAIASFFPSKYEGFGLPILESIACVTPVVTCRNSSLEEVGKETALYVDPDSSEEMAQWMHNFEAGKYDFDVFREKAILHVKDFSWEKAARKYVDFYMKYL